MAWNGVAIEVSAGVVTLHGEVKHGNARCARILRYRQPRLKGWSMSKNRSLDDDVISAARVHAFGPTIQGE